MPAYKNYTYRIRNIHIHIFSQHHFSYASRFFGDENTCGAERRAKRRAGVIATI